MPFGALLGGEARVHMKSTCARTSAQLRREARIRGSERPDEWITLGNHHDAWVFGGVDPSSGTATMMDLTRSLGAMLKQGRRPRRTLVFCAWDGEEVTLTGSTEWGEQFAAELKQKLVAYLNVDSSARAAPASADRWRRCSSTRARPRGPVGRVAHDAMRNRLRAPGPKDGLPLEQALMDAHRERSDHTVFLNFPGRSST
jgi:Zn-dependent M28 family amino/carboxypeptidase